MCCMKNSPRGIEEMRLGRTKNLKEIILDINLNFLKVVYNKCKLYVRISISKQTDCYELQFFLNFNI